jgi:hypothetical protein
VNAREIEPEISEDYYTEVLNDVYGTVEICGQTFYSGRALRELDPTAFRCGKANYEDGLDRKWECGGCGEEYEYEDAAQECCTVECDFCGERFEDQAAADEHKPHCPDNESEAL